MFICTGHDGASQVYSTSTTPSASVSQQSDQHRLQRTVRKVSLTAGPQEGNVLFNNALNTFYLRLYGAMGRQINPSSGEPIELFLVPASAPRLV